MAAESLACTDREPSPPPALASEVVGLPTLTQQAAHVLWRYCMRLASSGVGGVRRVRLALLYVGSCVSVLWMMFWMRLASSGVCGGGPLGIGCRPKANRTRRTPPTPDDASRMQYRHKTCATSHQPWPWSGSRSSANGLWGQGPPTSTRVHQRQGLRSERRAARRPTDYGARARAGGTSCGGIACG